MCNYCQNIARILAYVGYRVKMLVMIQLDEQKLLQSRTFPVHLCMKKIIWNYFELI